MLYATCKKFNIVNCIVNMLFVISSLNSDLYIDLTKQLKSNYNLFFPPLSPFYSQVEVDSTLVEEHYEQLSVGLYFRSRTLLNSPRKGIADEFMLVRFPDLDRLLVFDAILRYLISPINNNLETCAFHYDLYFFPSCS